MKGSVGVVRWDGWGGPGTRNLGLGALGGALAGEGENFCHPFRVGPRGGPFPRVSLGNARPAATIRDHSRGLSEVFSAPSLGGLGCESGFGVEGFYEFA